MHANGLQRVFAFPACSSWLPAVLAGCSSPQPQFSPSLPSMLVNATRGLTKSYGERAPRMQCTRDEPEGGPRSVSGIEECTGTADERDRVRQRTDLRVRPAARVHGAEQISRSRAAEADRGSGNADRPHVHADAGRSTPLSQEPECSLLRGSPARKAQLGTELAADAHQQRGRSVSTSTPGAGCTSRSRPVGSRQRPAAMGNEAG